MRGRDALGSVDDIQRIVGPEWAGGALLLADREGDQIYVREEYTASRYQAVEYTHQG